MQKEYATIKITNPITQGYVVKLYPNQKLAIYLSDINDEDVEINILSDFLIFEKREKLGTFTVFVYKQKSPEFFLKESVLFAGEIYLFYGKISASLCVYLHTLESKPNFIVAINPDNQVCRIDPNQTIDIYYLNKQIVDYSITAGMYSKLINIHENYVNKDQFFTFQLDRASFHNLVKLPPGKYDCGNLQFCSSKTEIFQFNLILNWNKKIPLLEVPKYVRKGAMQSVVKVKQLNYNDLESGCQIYES